MNLDETLKMFDNSEREKIKVEYTKLSNEFNIQNFFNISFCRATLVKQYMREIGEMLVVHNKTQQLYIQEHSFYIRECDLRTTNEEQVFQIIKDRIKFKQTKLEDDLKLLLDL